jgi:hypothetical protein
MTNQDLHQIITKKQNVEIENHKIIKINQKIAVPNFNTPYILPTQQQRAQPVKLDLMSSLQGVEKVELTNSPNRISRFFNLPELQSNL